MRVLFVCTGNICRSPTAEGVFKALAAKKKVLVDVDSAGTHDYHVGAAPDRRAIAHARKRGYDISGLRARQVVPGDFAAFDLLLAMDRGHLEFLQRMSPTEHRDKLKLFLEFAGQPAADVPDPYYGDAEGFDQVLDMTEAAARGLLEEVRNRGNLARS
jgi:protein-tyrosine phosphatase